MRGEEDMKLSMGRVMARSRFKVTLFFFDFPGVSVASVDGTGDVRCGRFLLDGGKWKEGQRSARLKSRGTRRRSLASHAKLMPNKPRKIPKLG